AEVTRLIIDEGHKRAQVMVNKDQLSIAIGRSGQNVRLASRLTGYELDIEAAENVTAEKTEQKPRKNIEDSLLDAVEENSQ
ncbi:MAG: transcription termination factor NusA, partial [Candidatus Binatia bacterium]